MGPSSICILVRLTYHFIICLFFVLAVSSSLGHVVALAENGEVFVWGGQNKYMELGCEGESKKIPTKLLPRSNSPDLLIVDIVCGGHHTLALDKDGKVSMQYITIHIIN